MRYHTIPDDVLDRIEQAWPHLRRAIANLRAAASPMAARQIEKQLAVNVLQATTPDVSAMELWALSPLTDGQPYGANLTDGVARRVAVLRAVGLSHQQIADRLADEGYGRLTRGRVAQIVAAQGQTSV